jgi:hypothetical protein
MRPLHISLLKAAGVGVIYAALGFMLSLTASFFLWQHYDGSIEGWSVFVRYDKLLLQLITALVAYLAARSYHPSRLAGFVAAICAAILFRTTELGFYAARSVRWFSYRDGLLLTVLAAISIGVAFGFVTTKRGVRHAG